ncbi:MAG: class I SAM-dependent methyltransferase [Syntrophobacteraceae bacterium]
MTLKLNIELTDDQKQAMAEFPPAFWFTQVVYRNAESPIHPNRRLAENNEMKQSLLTDWIMDAVKGKRVLDLFSANGAFACLAALGGAREVVGVEFSEDRVKCAEFVAGTLNTDCRIQFRHGDVYKIADYFDEPFDVVMCFGGLYHVADPAYVLRQIRMLTKERLFVQTSQVLPLPGVWAKFIVRRRDQTKAGMTSVRGGYGTWHCSPGCLRELLLHGGFQVVEERRPPWLKRSRYPWYLASCVPL